LHKEHETRKSCSPESSGKIKLAIGLSFFILILEFVGGLFSNSLALLSDAGHVFMDLFALSLCYYALQLSCKPATTEATYGLHRSEIFAALINGLTLLVISGVIFYEAYHRLLTPPNVKSIEMLVIAVIGLVANIIVVLWLHGSKDLNVRGAYLHVLGDTISSVAVIVGGVLITFTGIYIIDPILSILIAILIIVGSVRLIKESVDIFMEKTPKHIKTEDVIKAIKSIDGVHNVHDLHIWSICSNVHAASAHIEVGNMELKNTELLMRKISEKLKENFNISHPTLQFECSECENFHVH